jgi:uncharacterized protein YkwD
MTNHTATRRPQPSRPGSVRLRLIALVATACTLSLAVLPAVAGARNRPSTGRRHLTLRHHGLRRAYVGADSMIARPAGISRHHVLTALAHPPACAGSHVRISRVPRAEVRHAVNCLINIQRRDRGLPALRGNRRLNQSAQTWTNVMVRHRAFSHGADFAARINAVGFDWTRIGENIATGYRTPSGVVRAWMASTGHCQNILNPMFREDGTGVDLGEAMPDDRGTWTMDFGLLIHQNAASANWAPAEGCPYVGA